MCGGVRKIQSIKNYVMKTIFEKMRNYCANNAAWGVVVIAFLGWGTDANSPGNKTTNEQAVNETAATKAE